VAAAATPAAPVAGATLAPPDESDGKKWEEVARSSVCEIILIEDLGFGKERSAFAVAAAAAAETAATKVFSAWASI